MLAQLRIEDSSLIYVIALGFFASLLAIGVVFRKFSANSRDYFCANGQAKWWLVGGSTFMQSFSAWTFTGAAGAAYAGGWSLMVMYGANVAAAATAAFAASVWFRRLRVTTPADTIRLRYGPGMEQLYSYLQLVAGLLFSSTQLLALAIFTSALLGFPVWTIIVALGVVVLFYTVLAGAWAVLAADFVQALVLVPVTVLLAFVCINQMGGFSGMHEAILAAGLERDFAPLKSLETVASISGITAGYFTFGFFGAWYFNTIVQANSLGFSGKYLTVKDDREARKAAVLTAVLATIAALVFFIPPMTARLLIPDEVATLGLPHPSEGAYAGIALHLLPTALVGMVLVAMCAATMSSLDGGLNGLAAIITQNAYPALCRNFGRKPLEGRALLLLGRCANLGCAILVIILAIILARVGSGGVFGLLLDILAIVLAPVALPMALALWVRGVPRQTPIIAIVAGLLVALAVAFLPRMITGEPWLYHHRIFAVASTGLLAFFGSRLLLGPLDAETAAREAHFFALRDRPINFAQEVGAGNDATQMRIMGWFAGVLSVAFLCLLLPASSAGHAGKFIGLSVTCGLVCITLLLLARRHHARSSTPSNPSAPST
jgi:SSS family solute:Na+ symporter